ncbi:hypothetical protein DL96DRAFT_398338 [Flagelloscypha sp. PMI_526]|nr:hypothetical protein DL96DRAFT_398338 [Flagelloscypha sp. PMI_526]
MAFFKESRNAPQWVNKALGFRKTYNFVLWFLTCGALLGFTLARLTYLNGKQREEGLAPGEGYWYQGGRYKIGIIMHLACVLPVGILVPLQFVPQIRYKALIFHRINGYVNIALIFVGMAGALMGARHAFGGSMTTQVIVVITSFATLAAIVMAYINIKRLQIDQHRKWMIRAIVWMSFIVTTRIFMIIIALIASAVGGYGNVWQCGEVESVYTHGVPHGHHHGNDKPTTEADFASAFPECIGAPPSTLVAVIASFPTSAASAGAALREGFPGGMILAWVVHVFGSECYLALTKNETERLRQISYERQLEKGFKHPGSAGLTSDRLGDSHWVAPTLEHGKAKRTSQNEEEVLDTTR